MYSRLFYYFKLSFLWILAALVTACGFFDKDNTPAPAPLVQFRPEITPHLLWSVGTGSGPAKEYLKMPFAISDTSIYTASVNGIVTAINKTDGRVRWQTYTGLPLSTGPGVGDDIVVVASRKGNISALRQSDGHILWKNYVDGEILARPAVNEGYVVIKSIDGYVRAFSVKDGHLLWSFEQIEPTLILRGASTPLIQDQRVIVGFANGNLAMLNSSAGQLLWIQPIAIAEGAFAIQRMIDIDADPLIYDHHLYAATYQGKIAALDWRSGTILWSQDLSSYTGMTADNNTIYISDAKSYLWAFNADNGVLNWRQSKLYARVISGPAAIDNYLVVGDAQGYLHWLNKRDGHFVARISAGAPVYASPISDHGVVYVLTSKGRLQAYNYTMLN